MVPIENNIHKTNCSLTEMVKFSDTLRPMRRKFFNRILAYGQSNKYNEIKISHSNAQKHVCLLLFFFKFTNGYIVNKNSRIKNFRNIEFIFKWNS